MSGAGTGRGVNAGGVMSETACANRLCWGTK
jgi:hypothetical protein